MCICHVMLCYVIKTTFLISMRAGELHCVAMASLSGVLSCRRSAQYRQDGGPDGMLMWTLWCKDIEDRASQRIVTRDDPPQEFNTSAIERRRRRTARIIVSDRSATYDDRLTDESRDPVTWCRQRGASWTSFVDAINYVVSSVESVWHRTWLHRDVFCDASTQRWPAAAAAAASRRRQMYTRVTMTTCRLVAATRHRTQRVALLGFSLRSTSWRGTTLPHAADFSRL